MSDLDAATIQALLVDLGDRLGRRGIAADMYVVGGAAIALAYDTRRVTRDVHAVYVPKAEVYSEAVSVAAAHPDLGLPPGWLNDAVKGFLPSGSDSRAVSRQMGSGLTLQVASAEHLLALKVSAARVNRDGDDIKLLVGVLGLRSIDAVLDLTVAVLGERRLTAKVALMVTELLQDTLPEHSPGTVEAQSPEQALRQRSVRDGGACGAWVASADAPCVLRRGHPGPRHRSR